MKKRVLKLVLSLGLCSYVTTARAEDIDPADMSLETLMQIEVTSISKKPERASQAAAAIFVITSEDIRRSGATTIPEALRMAPGLEVARIDNNRWAISAQGSNGLFANKLLVLIDGRSVYTPLFSGVYWDVQDTLIQDIERIEVIRGPGASVWGSNAVNGVINIITKNTNKTKGNLLSAAAGNEENINLGARSGFEIHPNLNARVYAKYFERDNAELLSGRDGNDSWDSGQAGFRADWQQSENTITLQGDIYNGDEGLSAILLVPEQPLGMLKDGRTNFSGGNILGTWSHQFDKTSQLSVQSYFDRANRKDILHDSVFNTYDIEIQYRDSSIERHDIILGIGLRHISDEVNGRGGLTFSPESRTVNTNSGFIQDDISLFDGSLNLTLGSKFEHNEYSGANAQPTIRLAWLPSDSRTIWTAVSKASRTPSRSSEDISLNFASIPNPDGSITTLQINGDSSFEAEELISYEIGYREQINKQLSFDLSAYINDYDRLSSLEPGVAQPTDSGAVVPYTFANKAQGRTKGTELLVTYEASDYWQLQAWYSYLESDVTLDSSSFDTISKNEGIGPHNQAFLRSLLNLPYDFEFDARLRWVDNIPSYAIQQYSELDLRLGWHPFKSLELSLVGLNLLDSAHQEYLSNFVQVAPTEIERSFLIQTTYRW